MNLFVEETEQLPGMADQGFRQARSAGIFIEHVHRRALKMGIPDPLGNSQISGIAEDIHGGNPFKKGTKAPEYRPKTLLVQLFQGPSPFGVRGEEEDQTSGLHFLSRQIHVPVTDILMGVKTNFLKFRHLGTDQEVSQHSLGRREIGVSNSVRFILRKNFDIRFNEGVGKIVNIRLGDEAFSIFYVQGSD
jgi:hypothetical protein